MARRQVSPENEGALQEPIVKKLEAYFETVYEPGSDYGSVSSAAGVKDGMVIVYSAFLTNEKYLPAILAFMAKHGDQLAALCNGEEIE